jgi:spermidine synthase
MARAWQVLERVETADGVLELRQRGAGDFLITVDGHVLMNSRAHRSEVALAALACRDLGRGARVLIGGLGMAFTLRAALDALADDARVVVAEINPAVVRWCRDQLAGLTDCAVDDRRVEVRIEDVAETVDRASGASDENRFDAILFDLFEGPGRGSRDERFYAAAMLRKVRDTLRPGGILAVWAEQRSQPFEERLAAAGFSVQHSRPGRGGLRHAVYIARR